MNLRLYTIAFLISALPTGAIAAEKISLNEGDFVAAQKVQANGDTVVRVKLSKSGKAKFKKLNRRGVGQNVHAEIAGVKSDFKIRTAISGDEVVMGPYAGGEAERVVRAINVE